MTDTLRLADITFRYASAGTPVLCDVSLEIPRGEMVVLVGGSGSGKSTLLRVVAGLEQPSSGDITFAGRSILPLLPGERGVGMVFQDYALYPHLTVRGNLEFPLRARRLPPEQIRKVVPDVARRLHLEDLLDRTPRELSGGQRQRVALGRVLVRSPQIALFDEPLSNLDAVLKREVRVEIRRLHDAKGWTSIYVTHDATEAVALADRIAVIDGGRIVQVDRVGALRQNPLHRSVVELVASSHFNLAPPDSLPQAWVDDRDVHAALEVRALKATIDDGAGIPGTFLGSSEADLAIVQMPWGGHWSVVQTCDVSIGASVQVVLESDRPGTPLFFDAQTGWRRTQ